MNRAKKILRHFFGQQIMLQLKTQWIYIPQAELFSYVESMIKRDHLLSSYDLAVKILFPGLSGTV